MNEHNTFKGTMSELLVKLNEIADVEQIDKNSKMWPKEANVLSRRLNEIKSNLELERIYYEVNQTSSGRIINIKVN